MEAGNHMTTCLLPPPPPFLNYFPPSLLPLHPCTTPLLPLVLYLIIIIPLPFPHLISSISTLLNFKILLSVLSSPHQLLRNSPLLQPSFSPLIMHSFPLQPLLISPRTPPHQYGTCPSHEVPRVPTMSHLRDIEDNMLGM